MQHTHRIMGSAALALFIAALLTGCSGPSVTYVSDGREYTMSNVDTLREEIALPDYGDESASRAKDLRQQGLTDLRSQGEEAARVADLLTTQFPNEERAVPYYAEAATVDGTAAWIVLEAVASKTGDLDRVRLWVFDRESGEVLRASSFN